MCFHLICKVTLLLFQDLILPNGGTPAGTSSPASSSSLLNRLQLDDDIDGETRDLFVTVDDPKKHVCTMETYITYRITTKVGPVITFHPCWMVLMNWRPTFMVLAFFLPFVPLDSPSFNGGCGFLIQSRCIQIKRIICEFLILKRRRNCDCGLSNKTFNPSAFTNFRSWYYLTLIISHYYWNLWVAVSFEISGKTMVVIWCIWNGS